MRADVGDDRRPPAAGAAGVAGEDGGVHRLCGELASYHKTQEIAANSKVELCYLDDGHDQVLITGIWQMLTDLNMLREIWTRFRCCGNILGTPENPELIVYCIRSVQVRYMQEWALEYVDVPIK